MLFVKAHNMVTVWQWIERCSLFASMKTEELIRNIFRQVPVLGASIVPETRCEQIEYHARQSPYQRTIWRLTDCWPNSQPQKLRFLFCQLIQSCHFGTANVSNNNDGCGKAIRITSNTFLFAKSPNDWCTKCATFPEANNSCRVTWYLQWSPALAIGVRRCHAPCQHGQTATMLPWLLSAWLRVSSL